MCHQRSRVHQGSGAADLTSNSPNRLDSDPPGLGRSPCRNTCASSRRNSQIRHLQHDVVQADRLADRIVLSHARRRDDRLQQPTGRGHELHANAVGIGYGIEAWRARPGTPTQRQLIVGPSRSLDQQTLRFGAVSAPSRNSAARWRCRFRTGASRPPRAASWAMRARS